VAPSGPSAVAPVTELTICRIVMFSEVVDGGAQQGVAETTLRVVTRPDFPNPYSSSTILVLTFDGTTLGCDCIAFDGTGGDGGARGVKLSRTRFVLGCRSEVGCDGASCADANLSNDDADATSPAGLKPVRQVHP
jgi:hypothetical protein